MSDETKNEFEKAGEEQAPGFLSELWLMLAENKKYWLIPILLVLLGLGVLVWLGGTAAAPFIYTTF
jgi:hypothetical protein